MRGAGLEPPRHCWRQDLNLVRLPISPPAPELGVTAHFKRSGSAGLRLQILEPRRRHHVPGAYSAARASRGTIRISGLRRPSDNPCPKPCHRKLARCPTCWRCCAASPRSFYLSIRLLPAALRRPGRRRLLARSRERYDGGYRAIAARPNASDWLEALAVCHQATATPSGAAGLAQSFDPLQHDVAERRLIMRTAAMP